MATPETGMRCYMPILLGMPSESAEVNRKNKASSEPCESVVTNQPHILKEKQPTQNTENWLAGPAKHCTMFSRYQQMGAIQAPLEKSGPSS